MLFLGVWGVMVGLRVMTRYEEKSVGEEERSEGADRSGFVDSRSGPAYLSLERLSRPRRGKEES